MKRKTLIILLVFCFISLIDIKAQPYIFYNAAYSDTLFGELTKINRYNITTNTDDDFLPSCK